jgi:hypothetical protein
VRRGQEGESRTDTKGDIWILPLRGILLDLSLEDRGKRRGGEREIDHRARRESKVERPGGESQHQRKKSLRRVPGPASEVE